MVQDSDDRTMRTMIGHPTTTQLAGSAGTIDFADDAASGENAFLGNPDELVAQDPLKFHVTFHQLQIGFTDTGQLHSNRHLPSPRFGDEVVSKRDTLVVKANGALVGWLHASSFPRHFIGRRDDLTRPIKKIGRISLF